MAWISLVPFFCILDGQGTWRAFRRAYLYGFVFFLGTLGWFVYVTYPGAFLLVAFLSLYFAFFGVIFVYFQRLALMPRIFVLASCWTGLEFIRAHLFSGFGWVMLGDSQYKNLWLIQIADKTGVYGISFLVTLVNLLIFETWRARSLFFKANVVVTAILAFALIYGFCLTNQNKHYKMVRVGVVQPNIPLEVDWDENRKPWIIDKTIQLTQKLQDQKLDLIVWPETSLPGNINDAPFLTNKIQALAESLNTPILIGSIAQEEERYYNSAFLIGADGLIKGRYDKIHLVPFGEYLPIRPLMGWINKFVPLDDFTSGKVYKIFSISSLQKKFGVLICFEDTIGYLRRNFALAGADFFVNMTNDAWFKDTKAPFLHLQTAVFGCVENHRSLARAANTGVSALIDPWGRIVATVSNEHGKKAFVEGASWGSLPLNHEKTFYTKYGDIFTYLCFLCILVAALTA
ncbi:MAG: apolipoprotein N-acyltransferase [Candidatus Omnitrophica bacterium]|nr:apolipoprotein N-acyltransferase [Candidatus Omnitrophota bacterium]